MSRLTDFLRSEYPGLKDEPDELLQKFAEDQLPELIEADKKWKSQPLRSELETVKKQNKLARFIGRERGLPPLLRPPEDPRSIENVSRSVLAETHRPQDTLMMPLEARMWAQANQPLAKEVDPLGEKVAEGVSSAGRTVDDIVGGMTAPTMLPLLPLAAVPGGGEAMAIKFGGEALGSGLGTLSVAVPEGDPTMIGQGVAETGFGLALPAHPLSRVASGKGLMVGARPFQRIENAAIAKLRELQLRDMASRGLLEERAQPSLAPALPPGLQLEATSPISRVKTPPRVAKSWIGAKDLRVLPKQKGPVPIPKADRPVIPSDPAEVRTSMVEDVRNAGAKGIGEIQRLFPEGVVNRELAYQLRDLAWTKREQQGKPPKKEPAQPTVEKPKTKPEEVTNAVQEPKATPVHGTGPEQPISSEVSKAATTEGAGRVPRGVEAQETTPASQVSLKPVFPLKPTEGQTGWLDQRGRAVLFDESTKKWKLAKTEVAKPDTPESFASSQSLGDKWDSSGAEAPAPHKSMGAAAVSGEEFGPPGRPPTALKNAEIDKHREIAGLPPLMRLVREKAPDVYNRVMSRIDRDADWQNRIIRDLKEEMRPLSEDEHVALQQRYVDLNNDFTRLSEDAAKTRADINALEAKGEFDAAANMYSHLKDTEFNMAEKEMAYVEIGELVGRGGGGTAIGRAFNIRKYFMNDDFSLAKLEADVRKDKGVTGVLDPGDRGLIDSVHKKVKGKTKEINRRQDDVDKLNREKGVGRELGELEKLAKRKAKARKETPEEPLAVRFKNLKSRLRKSFENGNLDAILGNVIRRLELMFWEDGIRAREPMIDAIHNYLRDVNPVMTRVDVMDAMSGYGKYQKLTHTDALDGVREINGQILQVRKLDDMQRGIPPSKTGKERAVPQEEQRRLIRKVNDAKREFQVPVSDPSSQLKSSLDTLKTRMENRIADFKEMLKNEDYELVKKRPPIKRDAKADSLQYELDTIKREWNQKRLEWQMKNWSLVQKAHDALLNTVAMHRAFQTSFEMSAILRQGKPYVMAHPIKARSAVKASYKALLSEKNRHALDLAIKERPNYWMYERDGLYLAEHGVPLGKLEEAYASRWAEKVPGIAASERAYTTFLNQIRADWYDTLSSKLARGRKVTPDEGKVIANAVNVMTGRGSIPGMERAMADLAIPFFSPRYVASRFQMALLQPIFTTKGGYKGTGAVRRMIAKEMLRAATGQAAYYSLLLSAMAAFGSSDIELGLDPNSSDFLKIRIGNTRIDPMAGYSQTIVFLNRMRSGKITKGGRTKDLTPYEYNRTVSRFGRSKLSPSASLVWNLLTGQNMNNEEVKLSDLYTFGQGFWDQMPITYQDQLKTLKDMGLTRWFFLWTLAFHGEGVSTYEWDEKNSRRRRR